MKTATVGGVKIKKAGAAGAKLKAAKSSGEDIVLKVKKDAAAAAVDGIASPKKKGEKRKRDDSDVGEDAVGSQKKVLVVDSGDDSASPTVAAPISLKKTKPKTKPGVLLSDKVYKQFHGQKTLSEREQKLANMKKKERKTFRQQQKMGDNYSQLKEIKIIWESLRRASLDDAKRKTLTDLLCEKIKGEASRY